MSRQTSIKAFFSESNIESEQATGSMSVDCDPSDDSLSDPDCEADVDTQSGGASGYEQENESECTETAHCSHRHRGRATFTA